MLCINVLIRLLSSTCSMSNYTCQHPDTPILHYVLSAFAARLEMAEPIFQQLAVFSFTTYLLYNQYVKYLECWSAQQPRTPRPFMMMIDVRWWNMDAGLWMMDAGWKKSDISFCSSQSGRSINFPYGKNWYQFILILFGCLYEEKYMTN